MLVLDRYLLDILLVQRSSEQIKVFFSFYINYHEITRTVFLFKYQKDSQEDV